jgi:Arc/MetJ family transcription regulator
MVDAVCIVYALHMHRTTIEIDDALVDEAKRVLGTTTIRATVEEALRRSVQAGRDAAAADSDRQQSFLDGFAQRIDLDVLASDEMWK